MPRPSRPWFRFYVEALSDRKLRRLTPAQRWLWVATLGAARMSCVPGHLLVSERDPMDEHDLADIAGMTAKDVAAGLERFEKAGMICRDPNVGAWRVVAWADRQYESDDVTARTRKHRLERSNVVPGNVASPLPGTPPDTETETDTETPPTPLSKVDRIVDGVFEKVLAEKQRKGERIATVEGYRTWWDENQGAGCRERARWILEHYEMPNLSHYVDATLSVTMPPWSLSMRKEPA